MPITIHDLIRSWREAADRLRPIDEKRNPLIRGLAAAYDRAADELKARAGDRPLV